MTAHHVRDNFDHEYDSRTRSVETDKLDVALFAALGDVDRVKTDSENDFFKKKGNPSKYAGLPITVETLEPIFRKHGILVIQGSERDGNEYRDRGQDVALHLTHELRHVESGQFRIYTLTLPLSAQNPQQLGSAITYGRRYLHQLVAGAIVEDDDANTAVFGSKSRASAPAKTTKGAGSYTGKSKAAEKSTSKASPSTTKTGSGKTLAGKLGNGKKASTTSKPKASTAKRPGKFPKPTDTSEEGVFDTPPAKD